jgi:D-alanyl-D-alanine carboxypeptidase
MTRAAAVVLLALLPACSPGAMEHEDARLVAAIDSIVELFLFADATPGMSVAVVRGADTLLMKGYGVADVEKGTAVTPETVFPIASVTKSFTAAGIMRLVEDGRLRLDDTVGEVLPDYTGPGRRATIHHLLNHTSGIPSYTRTASPYWDAVDRDRTNAEMLALFAAEPLEFEPGSDFRYNNSGYYLLGRIIERVSGNSYGEFVAAALGRPAGLEHTALCYDVAAAADRANGYESRIRGPVPAATVSLRAHEAAGALCSTPRDLVRWVRALDQGRAVTATSYARMTAVSASSSLGRRGESFDFGYGLFTQELNGHPVVGHTGGISGFTAVMTHFPQDQLTIAVLANGPAPVWTVGREIAKAVLGLERTDLH